ncbi:hypothetical protein BDV29DRAFT_175028 [Aspergillus leporis]|uniref:Uncharacterized protein n=1 Tax=Aspergillus leporis TaxID=41062 RepID=A0A5N5X359_9EURO|nr:hypothetical protein BDV29DRAFT_175028 [Aspergillus leporis]
MYRSAIGSHHCKGHLPYRNGVEGAMIQVRSSFFHIDIRLPFSGFIFAFISLAYGILRVQFFTDSNFVSPRDNEVKTAMKIVFLHLITYAWKYISHLLYVICYLVFSSEGSLVRDCVQPS